MLLPSLEQIVLMAASALTAQTASSPTWATAQRRPLSILSSATT
jgi:hypothetical protein